MLMEVTETNQQDYKTFQLITRALEEYHVLPMTKWARIAIESLRPELKKKLHTDDMLKILDDIYLSEEDQDYKRYELSIIKYLGKMVTQLELGEQDFFTDTAQHAI